MNCNNYNTIKVTAGNAFSLLLPLKEKHYISEKPIEETINAALLTDVQVLLNNEEWSEFELGEDGVLVRFPSTLSKGVYNIELTAKYGGIAIRAAYFQCLSIVAWSYQSDAENYIPTSPLVADAAFVISVNGDEELTALKEQYRNAIAATEAEKAEYERKVAELDGVAQESTSQEILEEVSEIKGDNPNATNSAIYDAINTISPDLVQGKERLAAAITGKGVETTSADSLYNMAMKVIQIPQEVYNGVSEFEQIVAPEPYMWNIYTVAADLMKEPIASYLPAYMNEYKQRYAVNSFCVVEAYFDNTPIELSESDGFLTSDGHFYTIANGIITHTLPDGSVETYEAETITHTPALGEKANFWVAYFYLTEGYSFTTAVNGIKPVRATICGKCGSFSVSNSTYFAEIWIIGTIGDLNITSGTSLNLNQVIRGMESYSNNGEIFNKHLNTLCMPDLKDLSGKLFATSNTHTSNICADIILFPQLETLTKRPLGVLASNSGGVKYLYAPKLRYIDTIMLGEVYQLNGTYANTKDIELPSLEEINIVNRGDAYDNGFGILSCFGNGNSFGNLTRIYLPKLKKITAGYIIACYGIFNGFHAYPNLIDIEVGEVENNLNLRYWRPLSVLADPERIPILNENIRNHIAAKVSDRNGKTSLTLTIPTPMYDVLEQSTKDAFAAKNWIIATVS